MLDAFNAAAPLDLAAARDPGGSSAMILRIEARISSMLGSLVALDLDIPHPIQNTTPSDPFDCGGRTTTAEPAECSSIVASAAAVE